MAEKAYEDCVEKKPSSVCVLNTKIKDEPMVKREYVFIKQEPFEAVYLSPEEEVKSEQSEEQDSLWLPTSASVDSKCKVEVKDEITVEEHPVAECATDGSSDAGKGNAGLGPKTWTQEDMELALDALRNYHMSLTQASATYGIPSTTLWQRAHRMGIDTPKKEGPAKSWTEENLNSALDDLRTGTLSANKASKAYGIPSSTLYKIARREGIRLAAPFNAAPTTWDPDDLERALEAIRTGQTSVQRASTEFGIPTGTLYGRCKREGIELSRSNTIPWSEDAMGEALEAVRVGQMSINQAAIHYKLPYSSLYGRFKRGKCEAEGHQLGEESSQSPPSAPAPQVMIVPYPQHHIAPPPPQLPLYQQHVPHSAS